MHFLCSEGAKVALGLNAAQLLCLLWELYASLVNLTGPQLFL
jgi:hypothetical protein